MTSLLLVLFQILGLLASCHGFATTRTTTATATAFASNKPTTTTITTPSKPETFLQAVKIDGYDHAFELIDACAASGEPNEDLFDAVHFLEKNAMKIYPDMSHKEELWRQAHGSWHLTLSTGGGRNFEFHPSPPFFAFAMIDDENFGNGMGVNPDGIFISLLGPHSYNTKRRQMMIHPHDLYLLGHNVSKRLPAFLQEAIFQKPKVLQKPLYFVLVGATEKTLIARGSRNGGLALFARLKEDIRPVAYSYGGVSASDENGAMKDNVQEPPMAPVT